MRFCLYKLLFVLCLLFYWSCDCLTIVNAYEGPMYNRSDFSDDIFTERELLKHVYLVSREDISFEEKEKNIQYILSNVDTEAIVEIYGVNETLLETVEIETLLKRLKFGEYGDSRNFDFFRISDEHFKFKIILPQKKSWEHGKEEEEIELITSIESNQYFEGVITYKYKFRDKTGFLKPKNVKKLHGTQQKFYMWTNTAKTTGKVVSHKIARKAARIGGVSCNLLTVRTSEGTIEYYFNSRYKIDSEQYTKHNYQYWAFCLEMTDGAIPLKFVFKTNKNEMEITYTDIQEFNIADSVFDLPKRVPYIQKPKRMR